jgi:hypothetical protein
VVDLPEDFDWRSDARAKNCPSLKEIRDQAGLIRVLPAGPQPQRISEDIQIYYHFFAAPPKNRDFYSTP